MATKGKIFKDHACIDYKLEQHLIFADTHVHKFSANFNGVRLPMGVMKIEALFLVGNYLISYLISSTIYGPNLCLPHREGVPFIGIDAVGRMAPA